MRLLHKVDFSSDFTIFFCVLAVLFIVFGILLARVAPTPGKGRGRQKFDDTIVDRNRELID